jgi:hypothetical protein
MLEDVSIVSPLLSGCPPSTSLSTRESDLEFISHSTDSHDVRKGVHYRCGAEAGEYEATYRFDRGTDTSCLAYFF